MLHNRDTLRKNRANKAIQACLYSQITRDTICHLESKSHTSDTSQPMLLDLVKKSNKHMLDCFYNSQESIAMTTCIRYAKEQHNLIASALKNNEDIRDVKTISPHIVDEEMLSLYSSLNDLTSDGTCNIFYLLQFWIITFS